ncbi:MFS transporter, partial [bacterium]
RASGWNEMFDVIGQFAGLAFTALLVRGATNSLLHLKLSAEAEAEAATFLICGGSALLLVGVLILNQRWIREPALPRDRSRPWRDSLKLAFSWRPSQAPDFAKLYLSRCVLNLGIFTGADFLYYYVDEALPSAKTDVAHEVLLIAFFVTCGGVLGAVFGGKLGDLFSKRSLLYIFCTTAAVAATGFCVTESVNVARAIGFFYGIGSSAINTIDWAFATSLVPKGHEARYLAIFQTCFYLPQIAVGAGGIIGEYYGYRALFWSIPFWLFAGMLLLTQVRERDEIPEMQLADMLRD